MRTGILVCISVVALAALTLIARSSPAESRVEERGTTTLPAPNIVILTGLAASGGDTFPYEAAILNPGAVEGKIFFLTDVFAPGLNLYDVSVLPSASYPDGLNIKFNYSTERPFPVEVGVAVSTGSQPLREVILYGFYGEPTNVHVNEGPMVVIPGDFNLDGRVDLNDFNTFANNFTG